MCSGQDRATDYIYKKKKTDETWHTALAATKV